MIKKITTTRYIDSEIGQEYQFAPIENTISLKKTKKGYELRYLTQDNDPQSPADYCDDNSLFLVHYHRDFWAENEVITENILRQWYRGVYYKAPAGTEQEIEPDETKPFSTL